MKVLRILVMAVFLLTTLVSTASASGTAVGFIPMLTHVDPNVPIQVQARDAFDLMLAKLLPLRRSGVISEFEPSFSVGVLKVKYSAAANLAQLMGMQTFADMHAAVAAVPDVKTARPTEVTSRPSAINPHFDPNLYDNCFWVESLPANSHVVGKLQDKALRVVAAYEGDADSTGHINGDRCFSGNGSYGDVIPGYTVTFKVYTNKTLGTLLGTYTAKAPAIAFTTINNTTAMVGGTGPAGKSYGIYRWHPDLNAAGTYTEYWLFGSVSGAGTWSKDMSTGHFRGHDYLEIELEQTSNIGIHLGMYVPYIWCQIGGDYCTLHGFGFKPASLSIKHGGTTYTISGYFNPWGNFTEELINHGNPIFLKAGDQAWGTSIPMFALPNLTAAVNFATNVVSGKAPAGKYILVQANVPYPNDEWFDVWILANSLGNYSANFTGKIDLVVNRAMNIEVKYLNPVTGNFTGLYYTYSP